MNREEYDSFDEIYERYIVPCNSVMEAAANHKKFSHDNIVTMEKKIREEKQLDNSIIPYYFGITEQAP